MAKYHVNPETGNTGPCKATKGQCPFGGEENHYASEKDAREAYEVSQVNSWLERSDARIEAESYIELYQESIAEGEESIRKLNDELDKMGMQDPSYGDAIRALDSIQQSLWDDQDKLRRWEEELEDLPKAEFTFGTDDA